MSGLRRMLAALALGSAIISRPAVAQHGSSSSLTNTVTVTVPPRVRVQVSAVAPVAQPGVSATRGQASSNGLALTVSATQPWSLSIGSAGKSRLQWSLDHRSGFAGVTTRSATVLSGTLSQVPSAATLFFRDANAARSPARASVDSETESIVLTVTAQ